MSESENRRASAEPQSTDPDDEPGDARSDLNDLPDGVGCAEIWDHLSDLRRRD